MPEALPAVTVPPSRRKAGRSLCNVSIVVSGFGYSSVSTTVSPLRPLIVTTVISSLNLPAAIAAELSKERREKEKSKRTDNKTSK